MSFAAETVRGLPRVYWFLWVGTLINRLGNFVVPFLALYLTQERGMTLEQAGLVAALFGAGSLAAGAVGGVLADRLGRRASMMIGLAGGGAAMLHLGFARSPFHVLIAALVLGFVGDLYRPAVWAAVADLVPREDRLRAYNLLYWAINLGFAVAAILAGLLAQNGFWLLFAGDAATSFIMAAVIFAFVPETRPKEAIRSSAFSVAAADATAPFRDGVFMSFVFLTWLVLMIFMQHTVALPLDLRNHGIDAKRFGGLIAINGVLIVVLQPFVSRAVQSRRRGQMLALSALLVGLGFGLNAFFGTLGAYAFAITVWTLGEIFMSPVAPSVVADLAPIALRGTYQGVHQMAWGAATCLAPAIGSTVMARGGARALWIGCLALGALAAAGHLAIAGPRRRSLAALGIDARD